MTISISQCQKCKADTLCIVDYGIDSKGYLYNRRSVQKLKCNHVWYEDANGDSPIRIRVHQTWTFF